MISALISGTNTKADGSLRDWECAEYYGIHDKHLIRVIENGKIRQINLDTFTGSVLTSDDVFKYINGKLVSKDNYYLHF
jgi:hypothetical protein